MSMCITNIYYYILYRKRKHHRSRTNYIQNNEYMQLLSFDHDKEEVDDENSSGSDGKCHHHYRITLYSFQFTRSTSTIS